MAESDELNGDVTFFSLCWYCNVLDLSDTIYWDKSEKVTEQESVTLISI